MIAVRLSYLLIDPRGPRQMSKTSGSSTARETEPLRDINLEAFEKYQPAIHARLLDHVPVSRLEVDEDGVADTVFNDQYFYN